MCIRDRSSPRARHHHSIVAGGGHAGWTLHELLDHYNRRLLGSLADGMRGGCFPLMLKIIATSDSLSVQVHPDDATAERLGELDVGKTEMWYVLRASPNSKLICGLQPAVTRADLSEAIESGLREAIEPMLSAFSVAEGATVLVPAGTVHAIGADLVLAEIQQNSNVTYRLYDWGRKRSLHKAQAFEAIHFGLAHPGPNRPLGYPQRDGTCTVLAACRYFAAEHLAVNGVCPRETGGRSFHILLLKSGMLRLADGEGTWEQPLPEGRAVLVPGEQDEYVLMGGGECLIYYVPDLAKDIVGPLRAAGHSEEAIDALC